jgi:hypothetical protein
VQGNMISRLISKLFLLSEYSDHNNDGQWGNDTTGLSGVDAGAPAEGDCDGSWQHLEVQYAFSNLQLNCM